MWNNSQIAKLLLIGLILFQLKLFTMAHGRLVDSDLNDKPVAEVVARCRASCLDKFFYTTELNDDEPIEICQDEANCSMCWDYCQFLYLEKRAVIENMCTDYICVSRQYLVFLFNQL